MSHGFMQDLCLDFFLFSFFMEIHLSSFICLKFLFKKINFKPVLKPQTEKKINMYSFCTIICLNLRLRQTDFAT